MHPQKIKIILLILSCSLASKLADFSTLYSTRDSVSVYIDKECIIQSIEQIIKLSLFAEKAKHEHSDNNMISYNYANHMR